MTRCIITVTIWGMSFLRRYGAHIAIALLGLAVFKGGYDLFQIFMFEIHGAFNSDSPIYWAVSRGIINGLVPYRDLFEMKPPGLFLIGALSYATAGDMSVGHWIQALAIVLLSFGAVAAVWFQTKVTQGMRRVMIVLAAFVFGMMFAIYSGLQSGTFQTESFGVLPAVLAVACMALDSGKFSWLRTIGTALGIFLSAGMKEPFILAVFASAMLLADHPRTLIRTFLIPFLMAALVGIVALAVMGALDEYFTIYLPHMTGEYAQRYGPSWMRGFIVDTIFTDTLHYSFWLLLLLPTLLLSSMLIRFRADEERGWLFFCLTIFFSILCIFGGAEAMIISYLIMSPLPLIGFMLVIAGVSGLLGCAWYVRLQNCSLGMFWRFVSYPAAVYLGLYAVGLSGDYIPHHFVFFVPVYFALFFLIVSAVLQEPSRRLASRSLALVMSLAVLVVVTKPMPNFAAQLSDMNVLRVQSQREAEVVDTILDRCEIDRYLYTNEIQSVLYGFTRHSPMGPGFFQFAFNATIPYFSHAYWDNLRSASVILYGPGMGRSLTDEVITYIEGNFTKKPWPCAGSFENPGRYQILFRNSGAR